MKKVLVYGATGSQQGPMIQVLKLRNLEVFAATRSEEKAAKLRDSGANPVIVDLSDPLSVQKASVGMDYVSFVIPASLANPLDGLLFAKNLIDGAKNNGVKQIVWNTSGYFAPGKTGNPISDVKLDVKDYLQNSGVAYTIIESNIYLENLLAPYTTDYVKKEGKLAYPLPEEMRVGWIATKDASALSASAFGKEDMEGKIIRVSGTENLTGQDLAKRISKGLGADLTYYSLPPSEFGEIMGRLMDESSAKALQNYYAGIAATAPDYPVMFSEGIGEIANQLEVKMTSIEDWAKEHKHFFMS
ncbi:MAG: NmrA family transcriptional regulator [Chryseobacterium sp.]|nr:MAG: NmrA family transcriptional regulator [Chryseobacterium sp.]